MAGRGRGKKLNIPGFDPSLQLDSKPSELFPAYRVPVAASPTEKEKREVAYYLALREEIHKSSIYTKPQTLDPTKPSKTYGEAQFDAQFQNRLKPAVDPFEAMPRYTWKYDEKKRVIPQLSDRPFNKSLFPKELWSTLEGEEGEAVRKTINKGMRKKAEMVQSLATENVGTKGDKAQTVLDKIKKIVEVDYSDDGDREDDGEKSDEEEKDYDYEEDEDEMGGDYGAEQYFDGGEGDGDDAGDREE